MTAIFRIILASLVMTAGIAGADSAAGTTGANLLKVTTGGRQLAMGGAGAAMPGNLSSSVSNPALLAYINSRSLEFMHYPGIGGLRTEFLSYSIPLGGIGTWAGTVLFRTLPTIDNNVAGEDPVGINDGMLMMSLGRPLGRTGAIGGLSVKVVNSTLGDVRGTAVAVDLGMMRSTAGTAPVRYGVAVCNIGNPIKHENTGEMLPITLRGGASWTRQWFPHSLTLTSEASFNAESDMRTAAGVEWVQAGKLALRAGINTSRYAGWSWSTGAGWKFRSAAIGPEAEYSIDYAFVPFPLLTMFEPAHVFSLLIRF